MNLEGRDFIGREALVAAKQERSDYARCASAWSSPASAAARSIMRCLLAANDRRNHQRHVFAHAAKADRDGVRASRYVAESEPSSPSTSAAPAEPARVVKLPFYKRTIQRSRAPFRHKLSTLHLHPMNPMKLALRQNARMGPR